MDVLWLAVDLLVIGHAQNYTSTQTDGTTAAARDALEALYGALIVIVIHDNDCMHFMLSDAVAARTD